MNDHESSARRNQPMPEGTRPSAQTGASGIPVTDNRAASRFELVKDGQVSVLEYKRRPHALLLVHTEVPPALRGQHLGTLLVEAALRAARKEGLRVVPVCPFVKAYLQKHPETGLEE